MKKNTEAYLEKLIVKIRNAYASEFDTNNHSMDFTMVRLETEIDFLIDKLNEHKLRTNQLISEIEKSLFDDNLSSISYSEKKDEFDVIAMSFNTYMEELHFKMISKEYFQEIYNEIPINVIILNKNLSIENSNRYGADFFSISGEYDEQNFEADFPDTLLNELNEFKSSNQAKKEIEIAFPKGEQIVFIAGSLSKIHLNDQSFILFISKDITERKNQHLQIIEATIVGQEMERKRLALELHDSLGQELGSIKMHLNSLQHNRHSEVLYNQVIDKTSDIIKSTVQTVKEISANLKPSLLTNSNLYNTINRFVNVIKDSQIHMIFQSNDFEIKLKNKQIELFVYRIIQEFFNNSCKHANASMLILHILKDTEHHQFHFSLRDNGIGFNFIQTQDAYNGNGIANINYRLKIIKAKYNFGSAPNKGTFLNFSISY